jgi:putative PIN family toxin of toxin-antitoxin system
MRIVLDTNVLVSGLLSPHGPPGRIVDGVVAEALVVLFDDRILDEYRDVLGRPKFGFAPRDIDDLLDQIVAAGEHVSAPPLTMKLPDVDDLPVLEVAVAGKADALVTGNAKHFPRPARSGVDVLTPAQLVERWATLIPSR